MKIRMMKLGVLSVAAGIWCAVGSPARADPLGEGWVYHRPLAVKLIATDAPGDSIAEAEFWMNGAQKPDGSDLRVVDPVRGVVPMRILESSPDNDFVRIAFETRTDATYVAWWGNEKAPKPTTPALVIKRGILAEVYKFPGGPVAAEPGLRRAFANAGPPVGALFVPEIFLGYNPLGEEWNAMFHYTGQFKIDKPGTFDIAFTVQDSGMLYIDGTQVEERFKSGLNGQVRESKPVDLKVGWHTIDVTQVNAGGGQTGVVVGWRRPGEKAFAPLPATIFAPLAHAADGPLETMGKGFTADCFIVPEAEAFSPPDSYIQRYSFEARFPATFKPAVTWNFGDGQTSTLTKVHHYFMSPGIYTVTLKVVQAGTTYTTTRRITIKDRMYSRFPRPLEDAPKAVLSVLQTYTATTAPAEAALRAMMICKKTGDNDEYLKWGHAWLDSKETTATPAVYREEVFDLSRTHLARKEYKEAAEVHKTAAGHNLPAEMKLQEIRDYVLIASDYLDDPATALAVAEEWRKKVAAGNKAQEHTMLAALTYASIAGGDGKRAAKYAEEAGTRQDQPYDRAQLRQGVLARDIETYIRNKDFDTATKLVDQWEWDFPEAMVDGFTRMLRVKLVTAEGRPAIAARVALAHAKALPGSFYAAELLYRASKQFEAAGDAEKAKAAMELLKSKYPESPYAQEKGKAE